MSSVSSSSTSPDNLRNLALSIFASDALALSTHWVYNSADIEKAFGTKSIYSLSDPKLAQWHNKKSAGELTHFGDVSFILLKYLAQNNKKFDQSKWINFWIDSVNADKDGKMYRDHATKSTIENLTTKNLTLPEAASDDNDLGNTARVFPLFLVYPNDLDKLLLASKEVIQAAQKLPNQVVTGEFLVRVVYELLHNKNNSKPSEIMSKVAKEMNNTWLNDRINLGVNSLNLDSEEAVKSYGEKKTTGDKTFYTGLSCSVDFGLPAVVHFVHKYENEKDPIEALAKNTGVGGNNAARNIAIAMILYSYKGTNFESIQKLVNQLKQKDEINEAITAIQKQA